MASTVTCMQCGHDYDPAEDCPHCSEGLPPPAKKSKRKKQRKPAGPGTWIAAAVLLLLIGGATWVAVTSYMKPDRKALAIQKAKERAEEQRAARLANPPPPPKPGGAVELVIQDAPQPGPAKRPFDPNQLVKRQPIDDQYPLPQDMAKAEQRRAEKIRNELSVSLEMFEKHGNTNAPWADLARTAMEANARRSARDSSLSSGVEFQEAQQAVMEARKAGCDDPLVVYWENRFITGHQEWFLKERPSKPLMVKQAAEIAARLDESFYPAVRKAHANWNALAGFVWQQEQNPMQTEFTDEDIDAAEKRFWKRFKELAALPDAYSRANTYDICEMYLYHKEKRDPNRPRKWRKLEVALREADAPEWTRKAAEGHFLIDYAWDARGGGFADTVTEEGFRLFQERLEKAKVVLDEAWELDPTQAVVAKMQITISMGLGSERDEMETWFRRAMEADPDYLEACAAKLEWLQGKWHGSDEEAYDFAFQCFRTQNWYGMLPRLVMQPITSDWPRAEHLYPAYFGDPSMWKLTQAYFRGYLKQYPTDRAAQTWFAEIAVKSNRWNDAKEPMAMLGDEPWPWYFKDKKEYEFFKQIVMKGNNGVMLLDTK